jgi:hypothetical protein
MDGFSGYNQIKMVHEYAELKKVGATYQRAKTIELNGLLYEIIECHIHYVTNSNRRHRSKTCPQVIISDLVK